MRIVVTGGAGFIGSHLVDRYIDQGHEVFVLDSLSTGKRDHVNPNARFIQISLSDPGLEELILDLRPDLISHHAAQANVRASVENPEYDCEVNVSGTIRLLRAAGRAQVKRMIYASSGGACYGNVPRTPISETCCPRPISPYGISKLTGEHYVKSFAQMHGFNWTILRYANVYGPRQNPHGDSGVISIFIERMQDGKAPTIYGDGEQVRDYVHVNDVVEANMLFSDSQGATNGVFNVGTGRGVSLNHLVQMLMSAIPHAATPVYEAEKKGDLRWNVLSVEKIKRLKWFPTVRLEYGIQQLCQAFSGSRQR